MASTSGTWALRQVRVTDTHSKRDRGRTRTASWDISFSQLLSSLLQIDFSSEQSCIHLAAVLHCKPKFSSAASRIPLHRSVQPRRSRVSPHHIIPWQFRWGLQRPSPIVALLLQVAPRQRQDSKQAHPEFGGRASDCPHPKLLQRRPSATFLATTHSAATCSPSITISSPASAVPAVIFALPILRQKFHHRAEFVTRTNLPVKHILRQLESTSCQQSHQ